MASRTTVNVSLTPHLEKFVTSRVASGRYQSASEVVREALRLLEDKEADKELALRELREKIAVGLEQARRGQLLDGEGVLRALEARRSPLGRATAQGGSPKRKRTRRARCPHAAL
jgi:antitoxin ParD1/3/4